MMTKKEAVAFAKQFNWTKADAERAFSDLDLTEANEHDLLMALVQFSGAELLNRQRLQAAQKAQVTRKKNEIQTNRNGISTTYRRKSAKDSGNAKCFHSCY